MTPAPPCPNCGSPLVDATGDWQCHRCQRLWPASYFDVDVDDELDPDRTITVLDVTDG